jgi:hypothetical protein
VDEVVIIPAADLIHILEQYNEDADRTGEWDATIDHWMRHLKAGGMVTVDDPPIRRKDVIAGYLGI